MSVVTVERGAALSISTTPPGVRTSPTPPTSKLPSAFTLPNTGTMPLSAPPAGSSRWMVTRSAKKPLTTMPPGRGSGAFSCTGGGTSSSSSSSSSGWGVGTEV